MASEFAEQLGHCLERVEKVKRRDAAAGALRGSVFDAEDEDGTMVPLDHAARDDADNSPVPSFAREHERGVVIGHELLDALVENRQRDLSFGLLAILIEVVELSGNRAGAVRVVGCEELDDIARARHAARGVDARRDAECDLTRAGRDSIGEIGDVE